MNGGFFNRKIEDKEGGDKSYKNFKFLNNKQDHLLVCTGGTLG